jgi:putative membrane protein
MIRRKKENWFRMLFIWEGSVLPQILPRLILLFSLSLVVVAFKDTLFHYKVQLNPAPFTLFGIALALFLGFRNNASYERFWEGRKLWGALLNDTRSLARQAITFSGYAPENEEVSTFINYLTAFTYALKHQLRHTDPAEDLQKRLSPELFTAISQVQYKPVMIMKEMSVWVQKAKTNGNIDSIVQTAFDHNLNNLSDIVGGCERIASTPIPFTYGVLLHRTVYLYCFLLPLGFADSLGWLTPLIVVFIAYTFVALEAIADEIEEPFGTEPNDLALNEITLMIEGTLLEMAGKPLPRPGPNNQDIVD